MVIIASNDVITGPILINQEMRQGYGLSPVLFNLYLDNIIEFWKVRVSGRIVLHRNVVVCTLLFSNDQYGPCV